MSIVNTSEVNLVDLFVDKKITHTDLLYKLLCGALVTIVALRVNDMTKDLTAFFQAKAAEAAPEVDEDKQAFVRIAIDIATVIVMLEGFVFAARALR